MPRTTTCPDLTHFRRLAAGELADGEKESLLAHLEGCDACAARLHALPEPDTLADLIRQGRTLDEGESREAVARLVERLSKLRPAPSQAQSAPVAQLIFTCPACGKGLRVKGESAGKMVQCPHCKQVVSATAKPAAVATPVPGTHMGAGARARTTGPGQPVNTVDYQPAGNPDYGAYDFLAPAQAPDELGRLGPYRVLKVLGAGGMGVVFRAEDPQLARLVALKAMLPALASSASARQRFLREARAAAAIKHDHIVTIYQVGEDRGVPFLAMEFLEGEPLDARLARAGKLPVAEMMRIGREIALGLAAAHQRGLIHRDIKPANIWLEAETGRVKILDFGLARAVGADAQLTQLGAVVGTPAYMAPEQGRGASVDHRCDLFSLGCVLYYLAAGKPPFKTTDVISTLMAVATENPRPPHELRPALPPSLSALILGLLAKAPEDRPPSARAVADALETVAAAGAASDAATQTSPARQDPPGLRAAPAPRRNWPILAGAAACLLLLGLAGLWAAGVLRLKTPDGTIVVDNLPADAEVFVDDQKVAVKLPGADAPIEIQAAPGKRKLEIKAAGYKMETREVTLTSGLRQPIDVRLEPVAAAPDKPAPKKAPPIRPSPLLEALRHDQIPPEALKWAGNGDPNKAPESLVGAFGEVEPLQTEVIRSLAFSPDGRLLASASYDRTILLRDVATGRVKRVLKGHTGWITSVAFSGDGHTLASAGQDGTIRLWPVKKEGEPQTLQPDLGPIWEMAVSADGRVMAAGGTNGGLKVWKWGRWDSPLNIPGPAGKSGPVFNGARCASLALSPDGEMLAVAREEEKDGPFPVHLYRTTDGKRVQTLPCKAWQSVDLTFSPDGKYLASLADQAFVWDLASGKQVAALPREQFGTVAFSKDGKKLAVASRWLVALYDIASQKQERVLPALGDGFPVVFSPDGSLLAGGFQTGIVHVWDAASWKEKNVERGHLHFIRGLALSPDGGTLLTVGDDDTLRRWDPARPGENRILGWFNTVDFPGASLAYSPDGRRFALVVTGDGYCGGPPVMSVWDAAADKISWSLSLAPSGVAFSPDGKTLVGACPDGSVRLWDADQGREEHRFDSPPKEVSGVAFSKDGSLLAALGAGKDGTVKTWNVASGAELHSWQDGAVTAASFRPDGRVLAVGHGDGAISLWDIAEGKKVRTLSGHAAAVHSLKFTPDGKTLISSGYDGTIRLWNPEWERARQVIYLGPPNQRLVMDLDPSGKYLFAAGNSQAIFVLRLPPEGN